MFSRSNIEEKTARAAQIEYVKKKRKTVVGICD